MRFDQDPRDESIQLDECISEIKRLQNRLKIAEMVCEMASEEHGSGDHWDDYCPLCHLVRGWLIAAGKV